MLLLPPATDVRLAIDDLAFMTSIVPEPSRAAFLALGIFAVFGRRQRRLS